MDPPPPTPAAGNFVVARVDSDFDLPDLDYDDDPFGYQASNDEDEHNRFDRRVHAWIYQQCRFALKGVHHDNDAPRRNRGSASTTQTRTSAATPSEAGSYAEFEDARADSPLLGFLGADKDIPPSSTAQSFSPAHSHSRSLSGSSGGCKRSSVSGPLPASAAISRRPSVLRQPSLPEVGEAEVLQLDSTDSAAARNRTLSNASLVQASSPLPPHSPPTRRQSRLHNHTLSISSTLSLAHSSPRAEPAALSHASSTLSLGMGMVVPSMRNAVYIDSDEVRKRLDDYLYRQSMGLEDDVQPEEDQDIELPLQFRGGRHSTQLSTSSSGPGSGNHSVLFTPPPSAASNGFFSSSSATPLTNPNTPRTLTQSPPPPNTPMTHYYQTPHASSSQVYLGPLANGGTPPPGSPPASRTRSESLSVPAPISLPSSTHSKPPTRPPPAPPLEMEPTATVGSISAGSSAPIDADSSGRIYEALESDLDRDGGNVGGDKDADWLHSPPPSRAGPNPATMSKWSLTSSIVDDGEEGAKESKKDKKDKKRKSFISATPNALVPAPETGLKEKKRSRLVSFISRLSEVGGGSSSSGDELNPPPVPALLPSPNIDGPPGTNQLRVNTSNLDYAAEMAKITASITGAWEPVNRGSSKSAPSSPMRRRAGSASVVPFSNFSSKASSAVSETVPPVPSLPKAAPSPQNTPRATPLGKAASEGLVVSNADPSENTASRQPTFLSTGRARALSGTADANANKLSRGRVLSQLIRPRPTLMKSASASLLHSHVQAHPITPLSPPPLSPHSHISTDEEEGDESDDEDYGRVFVQDSGVVMPPPSPVVESTPAPAPAPISAPVQEYIQIAAHQGRQQQPMAPVGTQATKVTSVLSALNPHLGPTTPSPVASPTSPTMNTFPVPSSPTAISARPTSSSSFRQRLRSMSSVGNLSAAAAASQKSAPNGMYQLASASSVVLPSLGALGPAVGGPLQDVQNQTRASGGTNGAKPRGKGFKGFLESIGIGSSGANGTHSSGMGAPMSPQAPSSPPAIFTYGFPSPPPTAPVMSQPQTPQGHSKAPSPGHSPTSSVQLANSPSNSNIANMVVIPVPSSPSSPTTPSTPITIGGGLLSSVRKPKRKLMISGVGPDDVDAYEAVKAWCESLGEVREFSKTPNGTIYVDFKKASVAENVSARSQFPTFLSVRAWCVGS